MLDIFDFIILPLTVLLAATTRTLVTTPLFIEMVTFSPAFKFDNLVGTAPFMILADAGIATVLRIPMLFITGLTVSECEVMDKIVPVICVEGIDFDIFDFDDDILLPDILDELILDDDIFESVFAETGNNAIPKTLSATKPEATCLKLFMAKSPLIANRLRFDEINA